MVLKCIIPIVGISPLHFLLFHLSVKAVKIDEKKSEKKRINFVSWNAATFPN